MMVPVVVVVMVSCHFLLCSLLAPKIRTRRIGGRIKYPNLCHTNFVLCLVMWRTARRRIHLRLHRARIFLNQLERANPRLSLRNEKANQDFDLRLI